MSCYTVTSVSNGYAVYSGKTGKQEEPMVKIVLFPFLCELQCTPIRMNAKFYSHRKQK